MPTVPAPAVHKPKRFRLALVGAMEDQPRLLRAYGKACGGEFALVMRPREGKALMVFITREGSWAWRSGDGPALAEGAVRAPAEVITVGSQTRLRILAGPHSGHAFAPYEGLPAGVSVGDMVDVSFHPDDQFAHVIPPAGAGDAPRRPERAIPAKEAIAGIKAEQRSLPDSGPVTLRGQWTGALHCGEDAQPRIELTRKLAAYGTLTVKSDPAEGWTWRFQRAEKWFSDEGTVGGEGFATLSSAIEAGVLGAMRLVREACSFRDTQRRAAHDPAYAQQHPIPDPKPVADPTEKLHEPPPPREKKPRAPRKPKAETVAPPPRALDEHAEGLPDAPATQTALTRMTREVEAEADALAELRGASWIWRETGARDEVARWFGERGMEELAELVAGYDGGPDRPLDTFVAELREALGFEDLGADDRAEAKAAIDRLKAGLLEAPQLMERARRLVLYATRMVQSPLCRGKEQREAAEAIKRAAQAYEEARGAILEGRAADAQRGLRRVGERVALSAAKLSRSCALGQQSLTAAVDEAPAGAYRGWSVGDRFALAGEPDKKGSILALLPAQRRVRVRWDRPVAGVEEQELQPGLLERPATDVLVSTPAPAPRPRKPRAQAAPAPAVAQPAAEVDPAKDKALLDAFSAAIAAAMGGAA
ncbi:MAG: hypothetical protein ABIO70_25795 [Pseudomonadota bacterium]